MNDILAEVIHPSRKIAFEKMPEAKARAPFPELRSVFDGFRVIEDMAHVSMVANP